MVHLVSLSKAMSSKLFLTTSTILLLSIFLSSIDQIKIVSHLFQTKKLSASDKHIIPIVDAVGPESFAFDPHGGGPYTSILDGRIIKWLQNERRWIGFAVTSLHRNYISVIVSGDKTRRLMKYDPKSMKTTVLLENLTFPNGIALSKDGDFILVVADTTNCKILRLWLKSSKPGLVEDFAHLPGFLDNIRRNLKGKF
ncbi:protein STRICTOSIDINE SYNTHASE-LIKE 11-like [Camellia sinensis]|uniref:protein STRICTOSIDINE SYNTHASE-LIKE 11-like n=1 Tax=Camellia sinensis TaxID=4442 RepID=UPI0010364394|nr:protein STRICTOSIDINE SYNTHASE-LIKE 11-like [Camellia sinensis]